MRPVRSLFNPQCTSIISHQEGTFESSTFIACIARWREQSLADGVEHAAEAERRLLLIGPCLDLSNLGLTHLPDDVALPPNMMMLDLSGNPLLAHLPDIFFSQSDGMEVTIEGTSVSGDIIHFIQRQVNGIQFTTRESVNGNAFSSSHIEDGMDRRSVNSNQKDILNNLLSKGRDIRQRVDEVKLARDKRFEVPSPAFSLKKTPAYGGTIASVFSRKDLENFPSAQEMSKW